MRKVISQSKERVNPDSIGIMGKPVSEDDIDLTALEKKWEREGKAQSKRRYLRYYYRNRSDILERQRGRKKPDKSDRLGFSEEKVEENRGLIIK